MLTLVATVILYVFGFVFLYGVIRLAVRHGLEDAETRRADARRLERLAEQQDRTFIRDNAFLTHGQA